MQAIIAYDGLFERYDETKSSDVFEYPYNDPYKAKPRIKVQMAVYSRICITASLSWSS